MVNIIRILLSPFVFVYAIIVIARNMLFNNCFFKSKSVNAKIISIGNITVGGSGKTPAVLMLGNFIKSLNKKIGVLSRGYGRNSIGYIFVSDGKEIKCPVEKCGDEIILVAEELQVPAAVCEKRVLGAKNLIQDSGVEIIILDDAFQHRWIKRDLDIVLIDQRFLNKESIIERKMLPLGMMREPFGSLSRADAIIINRKFSDKTEIPAKLKHHFDSKKVFHGYYVATGIYDVKSHKFFNIEEFKGQKSLVVCGIAKPFSFLNVLEKNQIDITNKILYQDHANYTSTEIQAIRKKFYDTNSHSVLTTQKDAVKLTNFSKELDDIDIFYLKIDLRIEEKEDFEKLVKKIF